MDIMHKAIAEDIADRFDIDDRNNQAEEEMAELIQVICKLRRLKKGDYALAPDIDEKSLLSNYIEELADVSITVHQLVYLAGVDKVNQAIDEKLRRTLERLESKKKISKKLP